MLARNVIKSLGYAKRFVELGPMIYYALLGLYALASMTLSSAPSSKQVWAIYLQLAPAMRYPMGAATNYLAINSVQLSLLSVFFIFLGFIAFDTRRRTFRFFYFHGALLLCLQSLLTGSSFNWITPFSVELLLADFHRNETGYLMLAAISIACLSWHARTLGRLWRRYNLEEAT